MYGQHWEQRAAGGGVDPSASVFDPNSFYNLGRCLQEQGQVSKLTRQWEGTTSTNRFDEVMMMYHVEASLIVCFVHILEKDVRFVFVKQSVGLKSQLSSSLHCSPDDELLTKNVLCISHL